MSTQQQQQSNLQSKQSLIDFIQNQWDLILCPQKRHKTLISKICIDSRCNPLTEQYQLVCDKCIAENKTHQNGLLQHKTLELDLGLINLVNQLFQEKGNQGQNSDLANSLSILDSIKNYLNNLLPQMKYIEAQVQKQILYVQSSLSYINLQIQEESTKSEKFNQNMKSIIIEILKSQTLTSQQEAINKLKECTSVAKDFNTLNMKLQKLDLVFTEQKQNFEGIYKSKIENWVAQYSKINDVVNQMQFFRVLDIAINLSQNIKPNNKIQLKEIQKYYSRQFKFPLVENEQVISQMNLQQMPVTFDDKLIQVLQQLSEQKFYPATFLLGFFHFQGILCKQSNEQAFNCFIKSNEEAGECEDAVSQYYIGAQYLYGLGIQKNESEALKCFQKSAEKQFSMGQISLGDCYLHGTGISKDLSEAFKYCQLSSNQNNPYGYNNLGICYDNGYGVEKNPNQAQQLYLMAAEQGLSFAQYQLAQHLKDGIGTEKNIDQAKSYLKLASEQNHPSAKQELEKLSQNN